MSGQSFFKADVPRRTVAWIGILAFIFAVFALTVILESEVSFVIGWLVSVIIAFAIVFIYLKITTKPDPPDPVYVPLLIVISVVMIVGYTGWALTWDSYPPATPSVVLATQDISCRSVRLGFNITVEEPTSWYQDDTGIASVSVDGNTQIINSTDKFSHTFPHFETYSDCSGVLLLTLTATDHASNSATYNINISNAPKPYCCDGREAEEHNCDCGGFKKD